MKNNNDLKEFTSFYNEAMKNNLTEEQVGNLVNDAFCDGCIEVKSECVCKKQ